MKKNNLKKWGWLVAVSGLAIIPALEYQGNESVYQPRESKVEGGLHAGAAEFYHRMHAEVGTDKVNLELIKSVEKDVEKMTSRSTKSAVGLQWVEKGPDNVGGRTRAVTVDRDNSSRIYTGSVSGGLFVSDNRANTWSQLLSFNDNTAISSMDMTLNGDLIVGTGASAFEGNATGTGGSEFRGNGIYISKDKGNSFSHIMDPQNQAYDYNSDLGDINEIVADPLNGNRVWVASREGLFRLDVTTGETFKPTGIPSSASVRDVSITADGNTLLAVAGTVVYRSKNAGETFSSVSGAGSGQLPTSGVGRIETSIAQDDARYMYALISASNGQLLNAYGSNNGGDTWVVIMPGNIAPYSSLFGTGQGGYDNVISAVPGNPGECIIGGVTLWKSGVESQPEQIALNFTSEVSPLYVHSDIHEFTWSPDGLLYIGCDGGIHVSDDKAQTFYRANRFYNVTQFYSTDFDGFDNVVGGTQDNGTQFIDGTGITPESAFEIMGGDGFSCELSLLDPDYKFGTVYNGDLRRSNGGGFNQFYDQRVLDRSNGGLGAGLGGFNTTFALYENENNPNAQQFITYVNGGEETIPAGTTITAKSMNGDFPQTAVLENDLLPGDTTYIQDKVEAMVAIGFGASQGYWLTRGAYHFNTTPEWILISQSGNFTSDMEFSIDGDALYYGAGGAVFRVSGLQDVWSVEDGDIELSTDLKTQTSQIYSAPGFVTGIATDPNDADHLVISIGGYGGSTHVQETFNATDANPTWNNIQGDMPSFPVYDVMIEKNNPNLILAATEYGVYSTVNGENWFVEDNGFPKAPVFEIEQQTWASSHKILNEGTIYAGTHGRGIWKAENFSSVGEQASLKSSDELGLSVYPNPTASVANLDLAAFSGTVAVQVLSLDGKLAKEEGFNGGTTGKLNVSDLAKGTYLVVAEDANTKKTARVVVR